MKNLQELSFEEATSIQGGLAIGIITKIVSRTAALVGTILVGDIALHHEDYLKALNDGYNAGYGETKKHY